MRAASFTLLLSMLLVACQHTPPTQSKAPQQAEPWLRDNSAFQNNYRDFQSRALWRYSAKIGLRTNALNEQASLVWRLHDQSNTVRLFGPLGMGAVRIEFDDFGVQISDSGGVLHRGTNAQKLLTRIVGWPLPVEAMSYWLFALPDPRKAFEYRLNDQGYISTMNQLGWNIDFSDYRDYQGKVLPRKILANKRFADEHLGQVSVRLITKDWQFGAEDE